MEIISLLGQNLAGMPGSENAGSRLLISSTEMFTQFKVIRDFERGVRKALNLDMFSIRTRLLQNAVMQMAGMNNELDEDRSPFGVYFDNTTIFLGKYIGADMFLQAMFAIRYTPERNDERFGGLKIEPDIGIEWRGPWFNIQWNLVPEHPENLYIDDLSFTLSWKRSF
jgi:hypothetical protein